MPGRCWLASWASLVKFRQLEDPVSNKKRLSSDHTHGCLPSHVCVYRCAHTWNHETENPPPFSSHICFQAAMPCGGRESSGACGLVLLVTLPSAPFLQACSVLFLSGAMYFPRKASSLWGKSLVDLSRGQLPHYCPQNCVRGRCHPPQLL